MTDGVPTQNTSATQKRVGAAKTDHMPARCSRRPGWRGERAMAPPSTLRHPRAPPACGDCRLQVCAGGPFSGRVGLFVGREGRKMAHFGLRGEKNRFFEFVEQHDGLQRNKVPHFRHWCADADCPGHGAA
ncbi:hypothetical protein KL930_002320 [Ogataea haglerorum]|uniref:uncharacterized protein n=1 Tax=Ogataea haglerorum TaxID=1937702 RepID=UPI001C89C28E|nr:uncharacterized protein KL911_000074 [Ogataea haglerorum]KAG7700496.1 hypothetical protein KL951_000611 [Ogataea haglerorum]KAG7734050.1 hypothetical protein KL948_001252 [Ogataea haglerorum]KAG7758937.1 hypothetical protein KL911_000074 [Ogataea haglerorum]KAG7774658.1 hypothetical protein KL922_004637 [Ogataea haglerorum]KAG7779675.1 hypothetical protein KL930_002320 [Ogataea haglerorum]